MLLVELKTPLDFRIHGNLSRSPSAQIRQKIGLYNTIIQAGEGPDLCGTVRQLSTSKCFDWWINAFGDVVLMDSK